jgi:8-oxo-dGTP pyrophosphatase MutT (NUDIX family)
VTWLAEVEERLAARPVLRLSEAAGLTGAAVLVPLFVDGGQLWVVLVRNPGTLDGDAGVVALAGGRRGAGDEDELATALREGAAMLGVDPSVPIVLGYLDDQPTSAGLVISPVVVALPSSASGGPVGGRSDAAVRLPLAALTRPDLVEHHEVELAGERVLAPTLHYRSLRIGGAAARIVADLVERLTGSPPVAP